MGNKRRPKLRGILAAGGTLVLLTGFASLLLAPATRWVVQKQLWAALHIPGHLLDGGYRLAETVERAKVIADRNPADTGLAVVYADRWAAQTNEADNNADATDKAAQKRRAGRQIDALTAVQRRHPDAGLPGALLLRRLCQNRLTLSRPRDENLVLYRLISATQGIPWVSEKNAPADLAQFDQVTADGEKACPNNGYFPFMRSVGLLIAHRDTEARAALLRAGNCTTWDDSCLPKWTARPAFMPRCMGH